MTKIYNLQKMNQSFTEQKIEKIILFQTTQ